MTMSVYTGLPATGKTSNIIRSMKDFQDNGGQVVLFLSAEHPELTNRPNVRPGGLMGCRDGELSFKIDHVLETDESIERLGKLEPQVMAVFDEAQYFKPAIVDAWQIAADRGVKVLVGTPSKAQLDRLRKNGNDIIELTVPCSMCGKSDATSVIYEHDITYPTHLCSECNNERFSETLQTLFSEVCESEPFPGELKTYQPFHGVEMKGWEFVRPDSLARFQLMKNAIERTPRLNQNDFRPGYSYMDLGSCSGFFCDAMTTIGFSSTGVDVTKNFIDWADRLAKLKGQKITYLKEDARAFITASDEQFDVTSSFATIQWVMTQQGYEAGVECFKHLFNRTRHICVVEIGYTLEKIYKDRIPDRPHEIDKNWVLRIMQEHGDFDEIEVHPAGENGLWRDVFIGYKSKQVQRSLRDHSRVTSLKLLNTRLKMWVKSRLRNISGNTNWLSRNLKCLFSPRKSIVKSVKEIPVKEIVNKIRGKENFLSLNTTLEPEALKDRLDKWAPWSIRVDFSNGVSTMDCERRIPFSTNPLQKIITANRGIDLEKFRGGRLLDIGCASGYNSIYCATKYEMSATGIDYNPKHIEVSTFLSEVAGVKNSCSFELASAEEYVKAGVYDVVLHFGTLYHLRNPLLSLQNAFESLKPGGYLALETQVYDHPDDNNICYFMHMQNNDSTNFWALSTHVLNKTLMLAGFEQPNELLKVSPEMLEMHMHRIIMVARKPEEN